MTEEKTGFEATQELPISDKEILLILDLAVSGRDYLYTEIRNPLHSRESKDRIMDRIADISILIQKLKLT